MKIDARTGGLWLGLLLALIVANRGIAGHERTLAEGRVVLLELAPVDPRSLMQGDYMALRFDVADDIHAAGNPACRKYRERMKAARARGEDAADGNSAAALACMQGAFVDAAPAFPARDGYVVVALDRDRVGRFVRIQSAPTPVGRNELAVRFRERDWRGARIAGDAWFFPEGQASRYAPARYGELRVADDGTALLTGLYDRDRKRL